MRWFGRSWCDLDWTVWVPFSPSSSGFRAIPKSPGVYRVRPSGSAQLARKCTSARVMKDPATDYLSDYYPMMADFDWP
ncbi:MAG TPA: hypothetical protein DIU35_20405 [Candidatus Latescibacteria bacterium]|nr:hypothetical protein [Candidatus Latescibacterota bacterium]|tara:strand:+ start:653 stop:886 length:234 start_codon:yes stop_codon:yes gene_type:complete